MTILIWYLWMQGLSALGLLLAWPLLRHLPDRGYCAAKTLGPLFVGLVLWWGYACGLLRNTEGGAALAVLALAAFAVARSSGERIGFPAEVAAWARRRWRLIATVEVLQLLAFLGWCLVRAHDPAADHTEEPMDLMLLVAVSSSEAFPPADPWLSGYPISYYYLGYWLLGTLRHLVGASPEVAYNLGQATWFGLLLVGSFGLTFNLTALAVERDGEPPRVALGCGWLGSLLVGLSANLALPLEWGRRWLDGTASSLWSENWWWWRSSRVVRDVGLAGDQIEVITEFPFFSYLLGDNHPHLLAMPVVIAALTMALAILAGAAGAAPPRRAGGLATVVPGGLHGIAMLGVVAGAIGAINTWDVPAVFSILVLAVAIATPGGGRHRARLAVSAATLLLFSSAILFLPYHLTASSQVRGVLPNLLHPTPLGQVVVMFATLIPGVLLLVMAGWPRGAFLWRRALIGWAVLVGAVLLWMATSAAIAAWGGGWDAWLSSVLGSALREALPGLALERWSSGWPTTILLTGALAVLLEALRSRLRAGAPDRPAPGVTFALLLAVAGIALVLLPEVLYLHDSFGTRMNTVFKFWYQAWLLLACAAAVGSGLAWARGGGGGRAAALLAQLGVIVSLCYPVTALWTKTTGFGSSAPTLDALSWIARHRPDERAAIEWVRRFTAPGAVVVQRSGASYRPEHNLPSIASGRLTLLGWGGHESQWRGPAFGDLVAGREEALGRIYAPATRDELTGALEAWSVDFVYLGPEEKARYGVTPQHESILAEAMDLVFENAAVRIYRRRG